MMDSRHIVISLSSSIFTYGVCVIIRMSCFIRLRNFVVIEHRRTSDVISIFQDGGHRVGNLLLSLSLVTAFVQNGENLCAYQIRMIYLNPMSR